MYIFAEAYNNKLNVFPYNDTTAHIDGIQKEKWKTQETTVCAVCILKCGKLYLSWRVGDIALRIVIEIVCGNMYVFMYKYNVYVWSSKYVAHINVIIFLFVV